MSRDTALFVALGALAGASLMASVGAWLLLWREYRTRHGPRGRGRHRDGERSG